MAYKPTDITGGAHPARFAVKAEVYGDGKNWNSEVESQLEIGL
jgi:hypothetical protein